MSNLRKRKRQTPSKAEEPQPKRPKTPLADLVRQLHGFMWSDESFQKKRTAMYEVLADIGLCHAAVSNCCRSKKTMDKMYEFLGKRHDNITLAALRTHAPTACPGRPGKTECATYTPCRRARCVWRITEDEVTPPSDAPIFVCGSAAGEHVFPLTDLPLEIITHIVRLVGWNFRGLRTLRRVCRGFRTIVDATLPTILVDVGLLALEPHADAPAAADEEPKDRRRWIATFDIPPLNGMALSDDVVFRGRPCTGAAADMLDHSGRTLSVLERTGGDWAIKLGQKHWGEHWSDSFSALMNPCPTDARVEYVRDLVQRVRAVEHTLGFDLQRRPTAEATEQMLLSVQVANFELPRLCAGVEQLYADEPIIHDRDQTSDILRYYQRSCSRSTQELTAERALITVNRILAYMREEAAVIHQLADQAGISLAVLRRYGMLTRNFANTYCGEDLGFIVNDAHSRIGNYINTYHREVETNNGVVCSTGLRDRLLRLGLLECVDIIDAAARTTPGRVLLLHLHKFIHATPTELVVRALWAEFMPSLVAAGAAGAP